MSESQYTIHCLLWCNDAVSNSDKVWGYFTLASDPDTFYNFWGRRGKKLTWKEYKGVRTHWGVNTAEKKLASLSRSKTGGKDYRIVDINLIEATTPGFIEEFENNFTMARLFDNFHNKHRDEEEEQ